MTPQKYLAIFFLACLLVPVVVSADRLLIYSEGGSDGRAGRASVDENWTTIIMGAGNTASTSASVVNQIQNSGTRPNFQNNYHPIIMWNTSSIPDDATITAAKIGLYRASAGSAALGSTPYGIVGCIPASNTTIANADYQSIVKTPRYASDIASESIVTGGYTNWSLNPAGIANVSKTAYTRIMFVQAFDIDGTNPGYFGSTYVSSLTVYGGEDFTRKPFIEISYTTGTINPVASFTQNKSLGYITLPVSFTDTSTYAPSTWYWSFGDGNTSPSQNPNHNYGYCGNFTVSLKVSNVAGSDWENKTNAVKVLCNSPPPTMKKLNHNATYLNISTYDGTCQLTHPSVIYTSTGWNGYNYLMAMTPYPAGVEDHENPSMRYSNDMFTWEKISGQPDPIISAPVSGHYSDPNIVLNGSTLYMFYRYNNGTNVDYINYTTTTDGILWTSSVKTNLASLLSPSFIYNGTGWEAWGNPVAGSHQLEHYTTSDLTTWTKSGTVSGINMGSSTQWHSEVKYYDSQYQMLLVPLSYDRLFYFNSTNGLTWVGSENNPVMLGRSSGYWDEKLYKSSFIERSNEFDVFYTGWTSSNVWRVGYSKFPSSPSAPIADFIVNNTASSLFHVVKLKLQLSKSQVDHGGEILQRPKPFCSSLGRLNKAIQSL